MNDCERSEDFKNNKHALGSGDQQKFYPRSVPNHARARFMFPGRRGLSGRYLNRGVRPIIRPIMRPGFPMQRGFPSGFRQMEQIQYSPCFPPPGAINPAFTSAPPNFLHRSPMQQTPSMSAKCNQGYDAEDADKWNRCSNQVGPSNMWVEAMTPSGRKFYLNTTTKEVTWERPPEITIINKDQSEQCSGNFAPKSPMQMGGHGHFMRMMPSFAPYTHAFYPAHANVNLPPPRGFDVLPSVRRAPEVIADPNGSVPNKAADNVIPIALVKPFTPSTTLTDQTTISDDSRVAGSDSLCEKPNTPEQTGAWEEYSYSESRIADWSATDSRTSIGPSDNAAGASGTPTKLEASPKASGSPMKLAAIFKTPLLPTKLAINPKTCDKLSTKPMASPNTGDSPTKLASSFNTCASPTKRAVTPAASPKQSPESDDKKCTVSQSLSMKTSIPKKQLKDKSRPVSSTPISGTCWCVVWTGDERVFFYDTRRKVSVWDRPKELLNRVDVDKLVEKPVLPQQTSQKPLASNQESSSEETKKLEVRLASLKTDDGCLNGAMNTSNPGLIESSEKPHVQKFFEMLEENKISAYSSEKDLCKLAGDPRCESVPTIREQKMLFHRFVLKKMIEEKNRIIKELMEKKQSFRALLTEAGVSSITEFHDFAESYKSDERFKAIESLKKKENLFNEYVSELCEKENDMRDSNLGLRKRFIDLLSELNLPNRIISWLEVEKIILNDVRYKAIPSPDLRESLFRDYMQKLRTPNFSTDLNASQPIAEIKEESVNLNHCDFDKKLTNVQNVTSNFKDLLNDVIKSPHTNWPAARSMLKLDHRWECIKLLEYEKEELFNQHIRNLHGIRKKHFYALLDSIPNLSLNSSWVNVREEVVRASELASFSFQEQECEKFFYEYLRLKFQTVVDDFTKLLQESTKITHDFNVNPRSADFVTNIEKSISKDKRYLALDNFPQERKIILLKHIIRLYADDNSSTATNCDSKEIL